MKILIVRNFPSYMDVRRRTYNIQELGLAKSLVRMGNTCGVVFWTDRDEEQIDYVFEEDRHICIYYKKGISLFHNTVFPGMKSWRTAMTLSSQGSITSWRHGCLQSNIRERQWSITDPIIRSITKGTMPCAGSLTCFF